MNWYNRQLKIAMLREGRIQREWSEEDLQTMKKLIEKGKSFRDIAIFFNTVHSTISQLNDKYQWRDIKSEKMKKNKMIADLYLLPPDGKGLLGNEIKEQYGFDAATIFRALKALGLEDHYRGKNDPYSEGKRREKIQNWNADPSNKQMISEKIKRWWDQFGTEQGERLKNRLLSYPTRQQAMNHLSGFVGSQNYDLNYDSKKTNAIYTKYQQIINNHTFPDEIQQEQLQPIQ
jgi:hypothetical protein